MTIAEMNGEVPSAIERIIGDKGMKKKAVAERAGLNQQDLSNMLAGRKLIKISDIVALCNTLDVTPNDLIKAADTAEK